MNDHTTDSASLQAHPSPLGASVFSEKAVLVPAALTSMLLLLFAGLTAAVFQGYLRDFDLHWLQGLRLPGRPQEPVGPDWALGMIRAISFVGNYHVLLPAIPIVAGLWMLFRKWAAGIYLPAVTGTSFGLNVLIKHITDRARPPVAYRLVQQDGPGYPSAHAMVNSTAWLAIAFLLAARVSDRRIRGLILAVGLLGPAAIGASRVYLGVHWITDVLAGWALGFAWALIGWIVLEMCVWRKCTPGD